MEWVETTGETVEDAVRAAVNRLGAHEDDVEIEVIAEPGRRLLRRTEARVRVRMRPKAPPAKRERFRRSGGGGSASPAPSAAPATPAPEVSAPPRTTRDDRGSSSSSPDDRPPTPTKAAQEEDMTVNEADVDATDDPTRDGEAVTLDEQVETAEDFLDGLLDVMGLEGEISSHDVDEEMVEVRIDGDGLGLLLGPRGTTLNSLNEVLRTVLQHSADGNADGRVRVDVSGYRERRREALGRFAVAQAEEVIASGEPRALEPMSSADRKAVHDALNDVDGVTTSSEGDDPSRWVVIAPTG